MTELRALAEKAFGAWQRGTPAAADARTPTTTPAEDRDRRQAGRPRRRFASPASGVRDRPPDFRPLQVINIALGGLFSSRINMNLREENGYTYGASLAVHVPAAPPVRSRHRVRRPDWTRPRPR